MHDIAFSPDRYSTGHRMKPRYAINPTLERFGVIFSSRNLVVPGNGRDPQSIPAHNASIIERFPYIAWLNVAFARNYYTRFNFDARQFDQV